MAGSPLHNSENGRAHNDSPFVAMAASSGLGRVLHSRRVSRWPECGRGLYYICEAAFICHGSNTTEKDEHESTHSLSANDNEGVKYRQQSQLSPAQADKRYSRETSGTT